MAHRGRRPVRVAAGEVAGSRYYPRPMTDQPASRPPSPWARFRRPEPGEQRQRPEASPPPTVGVVGDGWATSAGGAWPAAATAAPPYAAPPQSHDPVSAPSGAAPAGSTATGTASVWAPQPSGDWSAPTSSPSFGSYFGQDDDDSWADPRPVDDDPGRGLAIASVVFGVFFAPLGLVFGLVSARRSRAVGRPAGLALVGMVVASVMIVLGLVYGIAVLDWVSRLSTACAQLGPGDYVDASGRGVTCR